MRIPPARLPRLRVPRFRDATVTLAIVVGVLIGLAPVALNAARADTGTPGSTATTYPTPVEPFATYDPQTTCTKRPKPGTVELGQWLVAMYGGAGGAVNRPCSDGGTSEHKDGRAIDWTLDVHDPADRQRAAAFLADAFATDADGNPDALARRMGVMYVIWNDTMYAAWDQFAPRPYLSAGCRSRRACSPTLRHRDHLHISLSRAGAREQTSWYGRAGSGEERARRVGADRSTGRRD